jgi:hypothetical protein
MPEPLTRFDRQPTYVIFAAFHHSLTAVKLRSMPGATNNLSRPTLPAVLTWRGIAPGLGAHELTCVSAAKAVFGSWPFASRRSQLWNGRMVASR